VAVGVTHGPSEKEAPGTEARLFPKLPASGVLRAFARLDLPARKLPETREEAVRRAPLHQPPTSMGQHDDGSSKVGPTGRPRADRDRTRVRELAEGAARERRGAASALRMDRPADRLSELHHRFVELTGATRGQESGEHRLELVAYGSGANVPFLPGPPRRDPESVRLERHFAGAEGDRRDGAGDVRSDAGKGLELGDGGRDLPAHLAHDPSCRGVQVVGAAVVAGALPDLQDAPDGRAREAFDRRKGGHEPLEVRGRLVDARLLQ
jgi:hypothetical protein